MGNSKKGRPKSAPINSEVGRRIKTARKMADLTQKELADLLDVSIDTIRGWENSRHLPEKEGVFNAIASSCHVSADWLKCLDAPTVIFETLEMATATEWAEEEQASLLDEFRTYALIYSLQMCGYTIEDILDKKQYSEYMESSIRTSIEFYMHNLNEKKE